MSKLKNPPVPFLDLTPEFHSVSEEWFESIKCIGAKAHFILGPNVSAFETEFAEYTGTRYAVALANGTDALVLGLRALGIGPGDEVITTPYTFFASAEAINHVGATPVFVDIEAPGFNIGAAGVESAITKKSRAILPVHIFGAPVDMQPLRELAALYNLELIEDCAQACGAHSNGARVGSIGSVGTFSFYPTKILGCYGDGGMVTTNDLNLVEKIRKLRNHGATAPFIHDEAGYNSRLDEIQAALLRIKLKEIESCIAGRRRIAAQYESLFRETDVVTPELNEGHVFNVYTVRTPHRDRVRRHLTEARIGNSVFYPEPLQLQRVYKSLHYRAGDLPNSEAAAKECISLPIFPDMLPEQVEIVSEVFKEAL